MMLALHPELVRMEHARDFNSAQQSHETEFEKLRGHGPVQFGWKIGDLNLEGAVGNAMAATPEKGWAIINHRAEVFIAVIRDAYGFDLGRLQDRAPLP